ncbi:WhiB family transcriptional regulator (plasmid) [Streptomyces murinus]|uniref:WhiB family transcriptional regulator n=1 Tax=Streptomyces murinus TaxID=33900 RepID=UPI000A1E9C9D|nr:WhiB family transcriptional regulator [Streptomyces murinus]WDO11208.1 WhiB family transcriptional regulator [Streptomyces murinus]
MTTYPASPLPSSSIRVETSWDSEWRLRARCSGQDTDLFFETSNSITQAVIMALCLDCPVRTECLAVALDTQAMHGVFGGTTARWRMDLLKRHPTVVSWRDLFIEARAQHESRLRQEPDQ